MAEGLCKFVAASTGIALAIKFVILVISIEEFVTCFSYNFSVWS